MNRVGVVQVFGALVSFLSLACGNTTLDLGGPEEIMASEDPSVLGTIREQVAQLVVDGERLYWLGSGTTRTAYANGGGDAVKAHLAPHPWALRGCDKANCAGSRVTYAPDSVDPAAGFGVQGGRISWFRLQDIVGEAGGRDGRGEARSRARLSQLMVSYDDSYVHRANDAQAPPDADRTIVDEYYYDSVVQLMPKALLGRSLAAFDSSSVYFIRDANDASHEIVSLPLNGAVAPRSVVAPGAEVLEVAVDGDFLYWIQSTSDGARVQRARKDGTGPAEPLVDGLRIGSFTTLDESSTWDERSFPAGGLAFDSTHFYFAENAEDGAIKRCPLAGCAGAPEVIADPVRSPRALLVDGSKIYWSARTSNLLTYALFSCVMPQCSEVTKAVDDLETPAAFTKDEQYLYAATDDEGRMFYDYRGFGFVNSLRRFPLDGVSE